MVFLRLITRPKVSHELGNLLISLCNVASVSIVSEEHFTRKNSFVFGLGAETSHVEEFTLGAGMEGMSVVDLPSRKQRWNPGVYAAVSQYL